MSNVLSFKRLYFLLQRHWLENRKVYLLYLVSFAALLVCWFLFLLLVSNPAALNEHNQAIAYFMGLFIAGFLSGAFLIRDFGTKPRKINYHLLPAATFEKLLVILFYGVLGFFIAYNLIFYLADFIAVKVANSSNSAEFASHSARAIEWKQMFGITEPIPDLKTGNMFNPDAETYILDPGDTTDFFTAFFPIQSAFILGSIYFNKNGFFKTLAVLLAICMAFFILADKFIFPLMPLGVRVSRLFTVCSITDSNGNEKIYSLPYWLGTAVDIFLKFGVTLIIWVATYFRLKEKEI